MLKDSELKSTGIIITNDDDDDNKCIKGQITFIVNTSSMIYGTDTLAAL